jgi:ApaG protein
MSETTTRGVKVRVVSRYHPERSDPRQRQWFFSYTVQISNVGKAPVKLLARHWIITDANGGTEHVRGPGVVGEQPHLEPGTAFEYTSFCPLSTSMGTMHGSYQMIDDSGARFDAEIAPFTLANPLDVN